MSKTTSFMSAEYDPKVKRRSLDDPLRQHRRSSIPFVDRQPAVKFTRSVDQRKRSEVGPHKPSTSSQNKSILKITNCPILVSGSDVKVVSSVDSGDFFTTNDELEICRSRSDLIMECLARAERRARGAIDVLTLPTTSIRTEALSRFQGSMAVLTSAIAYFMRSDDFQKLIKSAPKVKTKMDSSSLKEMKHIMNNMLTEAHALHATGKKFEHIAHKRYDEWASLMKRNSEFRIETSRLSYPLYTHRKMPESFTAFEDCLGLEGAIVPENTLMEGYFRVTKTFPDGHIILYCELLDDDIGKSNANGTEISDHDFMLLQGVRFRESSEETQEEVIKYLATHAMNLLNYSNILLKQAVEILHDNSIDQAFREIYLKLGNLEYDEMFDPLCSIDLKTALGELSTRKNELVNTAEQIVIQTKWILDFTKKFRGFATSRLNARGSCANCLRCSRVGSMQSILSMTGHINTEEVTLTMPLTTTLYQDIFNKNPYAAVTDHEPKQEKNPG